jgi:hypothetical protein
LKQAADVAVCRTLNSIGRGGVSTDRPPMTHGDLLITIFDDNRINGWMI